ncbi:MAG: hypoxanthine phosphoribosyltransferase [Actinobacteria bacterium]|nr:hypoxanthine phosphoribosyltransferase [Actinomycetota bacterium]
MGVRAADLRPRGGRGRPRARGVHAGFLPARAGPLRRAHGDEAVARDAQEPQAAQAPRAVPRGEGEALLQAGPRTPGSALPPRSGVIDARIGEIYLSAEELAARVRELGAEVARDYGGLEPVLIGSLKASFVFLTDLSRAMPIPHALDFVELAGYGSAQMGGHEQIRVLKDLDLDIVDRDVLVVEDVVDTGLTLNYLVRTLELRKPRSIAAVTLLDRPYRRLVEDLPVRYVGFVVPDELFVGYGFDLDEHWRQLPDLRLLRPAAAA